MRTCCVYHFLNSIAAGCSDSAYSIQTRFVAVRIFLETVTCCLPLITVAILCRVHSRCFAGEMQSSNHLVLH